MLKNRKIVDISDRARVEENMGQLTVDTFSHLASSAPYVPLRGENDVENIDDFVSLVFSGARLDRENDLWREIWTRIDWIGLNNVSEDRRYGAKALQLLGHIGEACLVHRSITVPPSTLLMAMATLRQETPLIEIQHRGGRTYVRVTPAGEEVLHAQGRVRVSRSIAKFSNPRQAFALGCRGHREFEEANGLSRGN